MKTLAIIFSAVLATSAFAQAPAKPTEPAKKAAPAKNEMPKVEVKKPCKPGQDPEKDKCHQVKKLENKK